MTNIESLALSARTIRRRGQDTFSVNGNLEAASLDAYFASRTPEPILGDCQEYTGEELVPVAIETSGEQVIEFEKSLPTSDLIRTLQALKKKRKQLIEGAKSSLRRRFKQLVSDHTHKELRRKPGFRFVYLKEKFQKVPNGLRTKYVKVELKPRQVIRWQVVGFKPNGKPIKATRPVWVTPHVWRKRVVPAFKRVLIRPAGFYKRRGGDLFEKTVIDWETVRAEYTPYKAMIRNLLYEALSLNKAEQAALYKKISDRPKLMYTNTTMGSTVLTPSIPDRPISGNDYPLHYSYGSFGADGGVLEFTMGALISHDEEAIEQYIARMSTDHDAYEGVGQRDYTPPNRGQGSIRIYSDAEQVYATKGDEMLAYSTVASLSKADDYAFQWFRSLLELKDLQETIKPVLRAPSFFRAIVQKKFDLRYYASRVRALKGIRTVSVLKAAVSGYLLWKFAVQPTLQDIETLQSESLEWIVSLRRSLTALLDRMQDRGLLYHARAKFGANSRILKLGAYVPVESEHQTLKTEALQIIHLPQLFLVEPESEFEVLSGDPDVEVMTPTIVDEDHRYLDYQGSGNEIIVRSETRAAGEDRIPIFWPAKHASQTRDRFGNWYYTGGNLPEPQTHNVSQWVATPDTGYGPTLKMPVYAWNHLSGCIFAAFCMGEIAQLSSEFRALTEELKSLIKGEIDMEGYLTSVLPHAEKHLDRTFVAWELTPLSFVYDWFTNSHQIVSTLANLCRKAEDERIPEPIHGIWESKRCELMTGTVKCEPDSLRVSEYVSEWHRLRVTTRGRTYFIAAPAVINRRYQYTYKCTDNKVHLSRSGLYRVRRGEHLGYPELLSFAPRLNPNLDLGKLTTLAAMLATFTAPSEG